MITMDDARMDITGTNVNCAKASILANGLPLISKLRLSPDGLPARSSGVRIEIVVVSILELGRDAAARSTAA
jgi:hypothetical protein